MTMLSRAGVAAPVVVLGRVAAILALVSAALHLALLDASSLGSFAMVAMALACLPCAWHLWRGPTVGVWGMTAGLDVAMLLIHAQMLADSPMAAMPGHGVPALAVFALGVVGAQLVLAAGALVLVARPHR